MAEQASAEDSVVTLRVLDISDMTGDEGPKGPSQNEHEVWTWPLCCDGWASCAYSGPQRHCVKSAQQSCMQLHGFVKLWPGDVL